MIKQAQHFITHFVGFEPSEEKELNKLWLSSQVVVCPEGEGGIHPHLLELVS